MVQIFISHSRKDEAIRTFFDTVFAGTNAKAVRLEFEDYDVIPSQYIKDQVFLSDAVFVLLGANLPSSEYTESWVAFEVGLATAMNKDIWVFEPFSESVLFPVPYLDHYVLYNLDDNDSRRFITSIVNEYEKWPIFRNLRQGIEEVTCAYDNCRSHYLLHSEAETFSCPTCRRPLSKMKPNSLP
jgi:hypothetical protein